MLAHELIKDAAILIVKPQSKLTEADFKGLAAEIDPFIEEHGSLKGLLIKAESFPGWDDFGALVSHLRFVKDHHKVIARIALVTDGKFVSLMPRITDHFVSAELKHFPFAEADAAMDWIRAGD